MVGSGTRVETTKWFEGGLLVVHRISSASRRGEMETIKVRFGQVTAKMGRAVGRGA